MSSWSKVLIPIGLLVCLILGSGCGGTSNGGTSLSEVMTEDEDDRRGEGRTRTREDHKESPPEQSDYLDDDFQVDEGTGETVVDLDEFRGFTYSVIYRRTWSGYAGDAVPGFASHALLLGGGPRNRGLGYVGIYFGEGEPGRADLKGSIAGMDEFGFDLGARAYLTPDHTLLGTYFKFGLRIGVMNWDYREPVLVDDGSGGMFAIERDGLFCLSPYVGFGVSFLQIRHLHLGASVMAGLQFNDKKTYEDFNNDIFKNGGFFQGSLQGSVRF